ncbi:hypothetical protein D187_010318 [Cystobacter fuscus DSM 2262]|uniref:Uncharacterized protein n=1 Tax=Cystobacter fuscus (strain ATCC 25194 / DSM 2262 / NBRC 100088 / M29) TaxID=1242864 RepID=S9QKB2_CYSF2|nr:hypothetical protein D187_010318 [Cystobacter fuscus DSM 2262]
MSRRPLPHLTQSDPARGQEHTHRVNNARDVCSSRPEEPGRRWRVRFIPRLLTHHGESSIADGLVACRERRAPVG